MYNLQLQQINNVMYCNIHHLLERNRVEFSTQIVQQAAYILFSGTGLMECCFVGIIGI